MLIVLAVLIVLWLAWLSGSMRLGAFAASAGAPADGAWRAQRDTRAGAWVRPSRARRAPGDEGRGIAKCRLGDIALR